MAAAKKVPSAKMWELVARVEAPAQDDALALLAAALRRDGAKAIRAFGTDMVLALAAIGTDEHVRQHVLDIDDPDDAPYLRMSDDVFLYARCAVIASGRKAWQRVADNPSALADRWNMRVGEDLLALVQELHDDIVGEEWSPDGLTYVQEGWVDWRGGSWVKVPRPMMYGWAHSHLLQALEDDPAWADWWAKSGRPQLRVEHMRTPEPRPGPKVRRTQHRVTIDIERTCLGLHTADEQALRAEAEAEVRNALEVVAAKYRMPPMPPWPVLPAVPDLTGWEEVDVEESAIPWSAEFEDLMAEQGTDRELIASIKEEAQRSDQEAIEAHRRAGCFGP